MLYVGHFSFESPEKEKESDAFTVESKGGTFSCLVEAESLDGAADKFRDLIISHADSFEIFGPAGASYPLSEGPAPGRFCENGLSLGGRRGPSASHRSF